MKDLELIHRYVAGQLSEVEEHMVHTRIVQDPAFRNELEVTRALRSGMRALESRGEVSRLLAIRNERRTTKIALAAGLAAVAVGLVTINYYQARDAVAPVIVRETLIFERTRGGPDADVIWVRGSTPTMLELRFDVGLEPEPEYDMSIWRLEKDASRLAMAKSAPSTPDGEVVAAVDGALLTPGDYEIRLTPKSETAATDPISYTLAVRSEP